MMHEYILIVRKTTVFWRKTILCLYWCFRLMFFFCTFIEYYNYPVWSMILINNCKSVIPLFEAQCCISSTYVIEYILWIRSVHSSGLFIMCTPPIYLHVCLFTWNVISCYIMCWSCLVTYHNSSFGVVLFPPIFCFLPFSHSFIHFPPISSHFSSHFLLTLMTEQAN